MEHIRPLIKLSQKMRYEKTERDCRETRDKYYDISRDEEKKLI